MYRRLACMAFVAGAYALQAASAQAETILFANDLHMGEYGAQAEALQIFLNAHGFPIAAHGPGAPGEETDYFGTATQAALKRFQSASGLPATGYFGPLSRALVDVLLSNDGTAATTSSAIAASTTPVSSWLDSFNSHAPAPGWIPGFGGGGRIASDTDTSPAAPPDTTPPSVSMTAPIGGSTLAGIIVLSASASDNVGVESVQFAIDGAATGTAVAAAPYAFDWNSAALADGSHTITAVARDGAGNVATSSGTSIVTENAALAFGFISSAANGDDTGEIISWTTNQASNATVVYGTTLGGPYPFTVSSPALSTNHNITLPDLAGGNYYFKVVSTNAASTTATSTEQTFTLLVLG